MSSNRSGGGTGIKRNPFGKKAAEFGSTLGGSGSGGLAGKSAKTPKQQQLFQTGKENTAANGE